MLRILSQRIANTHIQVLLDNAQKPSDQQRKRYHIFVKDTSKQAGTLSSSFDDTYEAFHAVRSHLKKIGDGVRLMSPSPDYPPAGISGEALGIWKYICKKYADVIFAASDCCDEWARAISFFESACLSRNVHPWGSF